MKVVERKVILKFGLNIIDPSVSFFIYSLKLIVYLDNTFKVDHQKFILHYWANALLVNDDPLSVTRSF